MYCWAKKEENEAKGSANWKRSFALSSKKWTRLTRLEVSKRIFEAAQLGCEKEVRPQPSPYINEKSLEVGLEA